MNLIKSELSVLEDKIKAIVCTLSAINDVEIHLLKVIDNFLPLSEVENVQVIDSSFCPSGAFCFRAVRLLSNK